ncbi:MAG: NYN domain-containing protein [Candidatus Nomurabacteria bacterium]|nr:NYN domain-containing protein [Candidatus Nomurabacteria bacterium]
MEEIETYAFIDVQNTEGTADFLGFVIDWKKMADHLTFKYSSKGNYFYLGIEEGDIERTEEFDSIISKNSFIKPKFFKKYRLKDKIYSIDCPTCKNELIKKIPGRLDWKCNCDVDLTIDVIEISKNKAVRVLLFTGDGDFKPLVDKLMKDNIQSRVYIFSSPVMIKGRSRLAIKLRNLTSIYKDRVIFVDLDLLRKIIEKSIN